MPASTITFRPTCLRRCRRRRPTASKSFASSPIRCRTIFSSPGRACSTCSPRSTSDDTNWIIILKDVGPDPSVRTAREGEREIPTDLPERELTRGWLKASNRALDPERSKPWKPWHKLTRQARQKVTPGKIEEYAIELLATANLFRKGHRICVEITNLDLSTGDSRRDQCRISFLITYARAAPSCTASTTMPRILRICCCRSFQPIDCRCNDARLNRHVCH